jgi:trk system potassium uptake protein TrkH
MLTRLLGDIVRWAARVAGAVRDGFTPPRLFVGSFLLLITLCAVGLHELDLLYTGEPLGWVDSVFTATSAVCVTGLIVVDTATYFTGWGQAFLLVFIQLGGLGMITFTTVIILGLGRRLSLHHRAVSAGLAAVAPQVDFRRLARSVLLFTLLFEGVGAVALYLLWGPRLGWGGALWPAVFHSVSAFCNAGFSTFSDSLVGFAQAPVSLTVLMVLIVVGGLGFLTMEEVQQWHGKRRARRKAEGSRTGPDGKSFRVSIHSRLVLATTAVLLVGGALLFTFFEWNVSLRELPAWARWVNGCFLSVTARTAGFNTVSYGEVAEVSSFLTLLLMMVGGSPGSTAGGIKSTTIAVLGLLAWSRFRGRGSTHLWRRTLPEETLQRAVGLLVVYLGLVIVAVFLYCALEIGLTGHQETRGALLSHPFEAVSAINTVGLSMGVTGELTPLGRVLTTLLMFLGRVGPLTFASAIALREPTAHREFRYAHEDVIIG